MTKNKAYTHRNYVGGLTMKNHHFYIVSIWYNSLLKHGGYKVKACATSLSNAAHIIKALRNPSQTYIVRDGLTGKRYAYGELIDTWSGEVKI